MNSKIYLPVQLDGRMGSTVFEATHRRPTAMIYWHLDGQFIGTTRATHRFELAPGKGRHVLTLVDESGESIQRSFDVISAR